MPEKITIGDKVLELKTWDDVKTFDDTLIDEEKKIISDLDEELAKGERIKCSCLAKEGEFFYYCSANIDPEKAAEEIGPFNQIYTNHLGCAELQLWCIDNFKRCVRYKEK